MNDAIKGVIYSANAASHDDCAARHELVVPYLYRRSTRNFYWDMLCHLAGGRNVWREAAVLELGCGTGTYTDRILASGAGSFAGVDLSAKMLEKARAKFNDVRCTWVQSPLEEFAQTTAGRFDVIYSFSFLHHLPDISEGLRQIQNLLRPGGVYVALHELILPKDRCAVEKLDEKMDFVFGWGRHGGMPWSRRVLKVLPQRLKRRRSPPPAAPPPQAETDHVDFQLNGAFDLARFAGPNVETRGYCYLSFPWLRLFGSPINHRTLILRAADAGIAKTDKTQ